MLHIRYMEDPRFFYFTYKPKKYIPSRFFEISTHDDEAELYFFIDLLTNNKMFSINLPGNLEIFSLDFDCAYLEKPFVIVYDMFVIFRTETPQDAIEIAKALKILMENQKWKVGFNVYKLFINVLAFPIAYFTRIIQGQKVPSVMNVISKAINRNSQKSSISQEKS